MIFMYFVKRSVYLFWDFKGELDLVHGDGLNLKVQQTALVSIKKLVIFNSVRSIVMYFIIFFIGTWETPFWCR